MKEYRYIAKGKITAFNIKEELDFSIFCEYASDTNVMKELIEQEYVKIDDIFIPYHAVTSVRITEFDVLKEW